VVGFLVGRWWVVFAVVGAIFGRAIGWDVGENDGNPPDVGQKERRVERVQFETDRQRIVGDVTLPPEGYQSRFSDSLNRVDVTFIPLVDAEVSSIMGGEQRRE